jgi:hypothetical protein
MAFKKPTSASTNGVNFFDDGFYNAGGIIPEGDYALELNVQMFTATNKQGVAKGAPRLGVMITFYPLVETGEDPKQKFYSMGSNAHLSFQPNPETGKGLVPVPGGPATGIPDSTNWAEFRRSLFDSGLPSGIVSNDLSVLDGIHVHINNVDPPDRSGFTSNMSETQEATGERKDGKIPVVTEIKDDGKPWEGTGGIPSATAKGKVAPKAAAPKVAPKVAPKAAPKAPADTDLETTALEATAEIFGSNPNGLSALKLRNLTFAALGGEKDETAQAIMSTYFDDDDALNNLIGQHGYTKAGPMVKPTA